MDYLKTIVSAYFGYLKLALLAGFSSAVVLALIDGGQARRYLLILVSFTLLTCLASLVSRSPSSSEVHWKVRRIQNTTRIWQWFSQLPSVVAAACLIATGFFLGKATLDSRRQPTLPGPPELRSAPQPPAHEVTLFPATTSGATPPDDTVRIPAPYDPIRLPQEVDQRLRDVRRLIAAGKFGPAGKMLDEVWSLMERHPLVLRLQVEQIEIARRELQEAIWAQERLQEIEDLIADGKYPEAMRSAQTLITDPRVPAPVVARATELRERARNEFMKAFGETTLGTSHSKTKPPKRPNP